VQQEPLPQQRRLLDQGTMREPIGNDHNLSEIQSNGGGEGAGNQPFLLINY
jgi:hypothetical protein